MEKRILGNTGESLSIIGLGGIVVSQMEQPDANNTVAEAIDRGVNYFDVAPTYGDAEDRLGPALEGKRNKVFLACKTEQRSGDKAAEHLHASLKKLRTDHFDLYQLHGINELEEIKQALGPNGALDVFIKARKEGLIRYIGFTTHSEQAALYLMKQFKFDTMLLPVNWVSIFKNGFGLKALEEAKRLGLGRLAIKSMAQMNWPDDTRKEYTKCWYQPVTDIDTAKLAFRFTLSQGVTAAVPPGDVRLFKAALEAAENYKPVSQADIEHLKNLAQNINPLFPQP